MSLWLNIQLIRSSPSSRVASRFFQTCAQYNSTSGSIGLNFLILSRPTNTLQSRMYISAPCPPCSSVLVPKCALCLLWNGIEHHGGHDLLLKIRRFNVLHWRFSGHLHSIRVTRKVRLISYHKLFSLTLFLVIARKWPKLREIYLHAGTLGSGFVCIVSHAAANEAEFFLLQEYVSALSKLRHLHVINIIAIRRFITNQKVAEWLQWANENLFQYPKNLEDDQGPRSVVLYYEEGEPEIFNFQ